MTEKKFIVTLPVKREAKSKANQIDKKPWKLCSQNIVMEWVR